MARNDASKSPRKRRPLLSPVAWELSCPSCLEGLAVPGKGSLMWIGKDFRGGELTCGCGQVVLLPGLSQQTKEHQNGA